MDSARKKYLSWSLLVIAILLFVIAGIIAKSARSDLRALSTRHVIAKQMAPELTRLVKYEASEASLKKLDNKLLLPRLPMAMAAPDQKNEESFNTDSGWVTYRHSFAWNSLPPKIALEALAVLRNGRDGWRISEASMKALEDGSGVSLSLVLETARFVEPAK